jgi:23S rRNA (cytidine1920-2'-O)/16S rRNA (cytidine1409-2'-O)-methyltransferase
MENTNARYLTKEDFPEDLDGVVTDVSFISLRLIFPAIKSILKEDGHAFALIKPQFECEKKHIGKSGIVTPSAHADIVKKVLSYLNDNGLYAHGIINAPIRKGKNIEYILHISKARNGAQADDKMIEQVKLFVKKNSLGELE